MRHAKFDVKRGHPTMIEQHTHAASRRYAPPNCLERRSRRSSRPDSLRLRGNESFVVWVDCKRAHVNEEMDLSIAQRCAPCSAGHRGDTNETIRQYFAEVECRPRCDRRPKHKPVTAAYDIAARLDGTTGTVGRGCSPYSWGGFRPRA